MVGQCAVFPMYTVKTTMQSVAKVSAASGRASSMRAPSASAVASQSILAIARRIVRKEGFRGLYRGLKPALIGVAPEKAIKLSMNDFFRSRLADKKTGHVSVPAAVLSGAGAGFCQVVATCPMERLMILIQTRALAGRKPKSVGHLIRELGLPGLYRGTAATLVRDVPFSMVRRAACRAPCAACAWASPCAALRGPARPCAALRGHARPCPAHAFCARRAAPTHTCCVCAGGWRARRRKLPPPSLRPSVPLALPACAATCARARHVQVFFSLNASLKQRMAGKDGKTPILRVFVAGIVSGSIAAALSTPMDVIKTRLQSSGGPGVRSYGSGVAETFLGILRKEGARALFAGVQVRCMIISPLFGLVCGRGVRGVRGVLGGRHTRD